MDARYTDELWEGTMKSNNISNRKYANFKKDGLIFVGSIYKGFNNNTWHQSISDHQSTIQT